MSISSALNAGVAGLSAQSSRLATISDNIANSSTYGYKRVETEFDSAVLSQNGKARLYSAGGVRSSVTRDVLQGGSLVSTNNALDIAISGRGMLPVTSSLSVDQNAGDLPLMMTRTGSFRTDAEGVLRTESGLVLMGWPADREGELGPVTRDSAASLEPIRIAVNQNTANPTSLIGMGVNLPASETGPDGSGDPHTLRIEYFGNLGTSEYLDVTYIPDNSDPAGLSNTWTMEIRDSASDPANNLVGAYQITFDDSAATGGSIESVTEISGGGYDPDTGMVDLTLGGGPVQVSIGMVGGIAGLRQLASSFAPTQITKDGSPFGTLTSVELNEQGQLRATYDTGFVSTLYHVPLVDVPNPNGLQALGGQAFKISSESGSMFLWDAGDGPTGAIEGYAREGSTTDVAQELTHLIQTQRAYSSNAKIIQTVDEMLQETTNIKR